MPAAPKNPFPGMNPWLEERWDDVHNAVVIYAGDALNQRLPPTLRARMKQRVFVERYGEVEKEYRPDVSISEHREAGAPGFAFEGGSGSLGGVTLAEPEVLPLTTTQSEARETYIQIIDARTGGRVVTTIEVLSRSNKVEGAGRREYLRKQQDHRDAGVNIVEIDLIRGGRPTTLVYQSNPGPSIPTPYHVSIWRAWDPGVVHLYPCPLRQPLPTLRIPLRDEDEPVTLALQPLIDQAYERGRHDDIDYTKPPTPPLPAEDASWAAEVTGAAAAKAG